MRLRIDHDVLFVLFCQEGAILKLLDESFDNFDHRDCVAEIMMYFTRVQKTEKRNIWKNIQVAL
jgi:hypothetical protein